MKLCVGPLDGSTCYCSHTRMSLRHAWFGFLVPAYITLYTYRIHDIAEYVQC